MKIRRSLMLSFLILATLVIGACGTEKPVSTEQTGQLATIDSAEVEVGLGSPTPVHVTIDVGYPNTCAQISQINQTFTQKGEQTKITIEIYVQDMGEICNSDVLSFRLVLPINAIALPKGVYSVEVNGVDAGNFEFKN